MALGPEQAVSEAIAARHFADLAPRLDALDLQVTQHGHETIKIFGANSFN